MTDKEINIIVGELEELKFYKEFLKELQQEHLTLIKKLELKRDEAYKEYSKGEGKQKFYFVENIIDLYETNINYIASKIRKAEIELKMFNSGSSSIIY